MERRAASMRITWRMLTTARRLQSDPFVELRASVDSAAPDCHVVQLGAWDDMRHTPLEVYARDLFDGLAGWRRAARVAMMGAAPALVFSTAPVPLRAAHGGDACGAWHEAMWARQNWTVVTAGIHLLNRARSAALLQRDLANETCPCLSPIARMRARGGRFESMYYHPPHLHNLWDVQQLAGHLREQWAVHVHLASAVREAPRRRGASVTVGLAQDVRAGCCCELPSNLSVEAGQIGMWANLCRVSL